MSRCGLGGLENTVAAQKSRSAKVYQNSSCGGSDRGDQFGRRDDERVATPTQHPALDLREARKLQTQFHSAALQFAQDLRLVPFLFADVVSHGFAKPDDHIEAAFRRVDTEAVAQNLFQRKFFWARKRLAGWSDTFNPRRDERSDGFAQVIVGEQ